jgi:Predicted transcriptional regulators containing the CopG/Arc/MetJ DNA-binding domain and a metal-binding domain
MSGNSDKTKFSIRVDTKLLELCDEYIEKTNSLSRTDLIETAIRFYIGYATSQKIEDYLLQSLSSVLTATVYDSENRMARVNFKMAVELSKLAHVIAYSHNIDDLALQKLHLKCLDEVKRINGTVKFEEAYRYQKREP